MGSAIAIDYVTVYFARNKVFSRNEVATMRVLIRGVSVGLACIIVSGAIIFFSNPAGYMVSAKFITKMTVVLVLCVNGYILHRFVFNHIADSGLLTKKRHASLRTRAFICGAISLISWLSALLLALQTSIPFSVQTALSLYGAVIIVGVSIATLIAKKI